MIFEIQKQEFLDSFLPLMAEVECGDLFDETNPSHVDWVKHKIASHYFRGAYFYAFYLEENKAIGFVTLLIEEGPEGIPYFATQAEVLDLAVISEYRGRGYGAQLLQYAEAVAREAGAYCMGMFTTASDDDVIAFYGKHGFVPVATIPDVNGPGNEGKVWMRKILKDRGSS
jgi:ribosomal protein S18 acetylase RimI-like enzyme